MQLCEQLCALHEMTPPVIHRDIKPQNVVIRPDGRAVLIDFGIARVRTEGERDTVAFGTQGFAPPEQYGFSQTDARSDIFSLGILLYWLLHRETKVPREAHTELEKVIARCAFFDPGQALSDIGAGETGAACSTSGSEEKAKRLLTCGSRPACWCCSPAGIGLFQNRPARSSPFPSR